MQKTGAARHPCLLNFNYCRYGNSQQIFYHGSSITGEGGKSVSDPETPWGGALGWGSFSHTPPKNSCALLPNHI